MKPAIRDPGGLLAGLLFLCVGSGAIAVASRYAIGTPLHMGPGYFPVALGALLVVVGLASALRVLVVTAEGTGRIAPRPLVVISAAISVFAVAIDSIGLIPAVFISAMIACMAGPNPKLLESGLIAACLSILAAGIFFYGLKLPFALF